MIGLKDLSCYIAVVRGINLPASSVCHARSSLILCCYFIWIKITCFYLYFTVLLYHGPSFWDYFLLPEIHPSEVPLVKVFWFLFI